MASQTSFTELEYAHRRKRTRREGFLRIMDGVIPWDEYVGIVEPYYYKVYPHKRGRKPREIETMLRMYLISVWFSLADEACEEAIVDSFAFRSFMRLDFTCEQCPDATTLCRFRHLLEENGVNRLIFDAIERGLDRSGRIMHGGTIVDATIMDAPSSTKNAKGERDPEMHQTRKGNQWYFGMKYHIGVDAGTGYVHTVVTTAANVSDVVETGALVRDDDEVVYGDAGYLNAQAHMSPEQAGRIEARINKRKGSVRTDADRAVESRMSSVRSKVEHAFHIVKDILGFRKTRYKGMAKNAERGYILFASANLYMLAKAGGSLKAPAGTPA